MLKTFLVALLALALLAASIENAHAELISGTIGLTALIAGALGTTAAVGGVASLIGGAIVGIGVSVALSFAAKLFQPSSAADSSAPITQSGTQTSLTIGATTPRNCWIGPGATAGTLVYWNLYGENNRFLQLVYVLGIGPHDDITGIIVNGTRCTFDAYEGGGGSFTAYRPVAEFDRDGTHHMLVRFFHGYYDQIADQDLVDNANPVGRWTTDNRGRGVCYASITLDYLHPELFPNGVPQFLFEIQGLRLYDRRKDSTSGGSGLHRWSDQSTWQYSANVSLGLYLFERGLYIGDRKQIGRGLAPVDLISDMFVAAANICDETVLVPLQPSEPHYRIGMNIGADRDWSAVEHDFCIAMGGWLMESAGAYGPIAGTAQDVAFTFTDDDLLVGREVSYSQKLSRSSLVNTIYGTFTDPTQNWQAIPYPVRASSTDEAVDGGEFAAQHDYPMLPFANQVQRVGEIERRIGRFQATGGVTLGFLHSNIEQGDWGTWTSARRGFTKTFQVVRATVDDDDSNTLVLREISEDVFAFDDIDQLDPLNPGDLPGINELVTTVPDFSLEAVQINGVGGLTVPALHCLWSPIHDKTVDNVVVEYRIGDDGVVKRAPLFPPLDGEGFISDAIQASTPYQARANITTTPLRETFWTDWVPITAPPLHVVKRSLIASDIDDLVVSLAKFNEALRDHVTEQFKAVTNKNNSIEQFIASFTLEQEAHNFLDKLKTAADVGNAIKSVTDIATDLHVNYSDNATMAAADVVVRGDAAVYTDSAIATYNITVSAQFQDIVGSNGFLAQATVNAIAAATANANFAVAQYKTTVDTQFGTLTQAGGTIEQLAVASATQAISVYDQSVFVSTGGLVAKVSENSTAVGTISGHLAASYAVTLDVNGHAGGFKLLADGTVVNAAWAVDNFTIGTSGAVSVPVFTISTVGGVAKIALRGDMLADGTITASKIQVGTFEAIVATIGTAFIGTIHIQDAAVTVPIPAHGTSNVFTTAGNTISTVMTASASVTSTNGSTVTIVVVGWFDVQVTAGSTYHWEFRINGTSIQSATISGGGSGVIGRVPISGSSSYTANGSAQTVTIDIRHNSTNTNDFISTRDFVGICLKK